MERLTPAVRAFLEEVRFAVLATVEADGAPQQTVMWYRLDGDKILMNTAPGRVKARNLQRDPRASICVEDGYRYVAVQGAISMEEDQEIAHADITGLAMRYHGPEKGRAMGADFRKQRRVTLHMTIDKVLARGFD